MSSGPDRQPPLRLLISLNQSRCRLFTMLRAGNAPERLSRGKAGGYEHGVASSQCRGDPEGSRCAPRAVSAPERPAARHLTDYYCPGVPWALVGHPVGSLAICFSVAGVGFPMTLMVVGVIFWMLAVVLPFTALHVRLLALLGHVEKLSLAVVACGASLVGGIIFLLADSRRSRRRLRKQTA